MKKHYFICNDLDDLERIKQELARKGVNKTQTHILNKDDATTFKHDVINGWLFGAMFGLLSATLIMTVGYMSNLTDTYTWLPFCFLAIILFGFLTWSGGFYSIQTPHKEFRRFRNVLKKGKHVFVVNLNPSQKSIVLQIEAARYQLSGASISSTKPHWLILGQRNFKNINNRTFS